MQIQTRGNRRLSRADAQMVASVMAALGQGGAIVTPAMLLNASRSPDAPTHRLFEWDDAKAAEAHRLAQAGAIIRDVQVVVMRDPNDTPRAVHGFVSIVDSEGERGYIPTLIAMASVEMREQLLASALAELRAFQKKHATLTELAGVFAAIEAAEALVKAA